MSNKLHSAHFSIVPATIEDVPTLASIFQEAFSTDTHTQLKSLGKPPDYQAESMAGPLSAWSQSSRCSLMKAVEKEAGEILGWVCWGRREKNVSPSKAAEAQSEPAKEEEVKEAEPPATTVDPRKRMEALTNADMKRWVEKIMPPGVACMYIIAVAVRPSSQKCRVGSSLIRVGTAQADAAGLFCWVHSSEAGYKAFEKAGFTTAERLEIDLDDYIPRKSETKEEEMRHWGKYVFRYMIRH